MIRCRIIPPQPTPVYTSYAASYNAYDIDSRKPRIRATFSLPRPPPTLTQRRVRPEGPARRRPLLRDHLQLHRRVVFVLEDIAVDTRGDDAGDGRDDGVAGGHASRDGRPQRSADGGADRRDDPPDGADGEGAQLGHAGAHGVPHEVPHARDVVVGQGLRHDLGPSAQQQGLGWLEGGLAHAVGDLRGSAPEEVAEEISYNELQEALRRTENRQEDNARR